MIKEMGDLEDQVSEALKEKKSLNEKLTNQTQMATRLSEKIGNMVDRDMLEASLTESQFRADRIAELTRALAE